MNAQKIHTCKHGEEADRLTKLQAELDAATRLGVIALGAAGTHAERVVELENEASTLRESLAEVNRLLSLNVTEVERLTRENRILTVKCAGSLANNLCPDHRDKQTGKSCLACTIEYHESWQESTANLLRQSLATIKENVEADGGCDHSVGVCWCSDYRLIDELTAAIAKSQPQPLSGEQCQHDLCLPNPTIQMLSPDHGSPDTMRVRCVVCNEHWTNPVAVAYDAPQTSGGQS